jgi:hypothetical protein
VGGFAEARPIPFVAHLTGEGRARRAKAPGAGTIPRDTISTHLVWPHGAEILNGWGLLDRLAATGCPPVALRMIFDVGPFALRGAVTRRTREITERH